MDNIVRGEQHPHFLAHRQHDWIVHFEQVVFTFFHIFENLLAWCRKRAEERDVFIEVFVMPLPLVCGDFHRHVRVTGIFHRNQRFRGRYGHGDQDDEGDYRPHHFHRGALVELCRDRPPGLAVMIDGINDSAEHHNSDNHTDPQDQHMQIVDGATDLGHTNRHIEFPSRLGCARHG